MKALVVLFDEENKYQEEKAFGEKSGRELCAAFFEKAQFLPAGIDTVGLVFVKKGGCKTGSQLLAKIHQLAKEKNADFVIYSYADLPFLNAALTKKIITSHVEYKCEYTFADGFPYGFAPEVIDCGALGILAELARTSQAEEGAKTVCRETIWNLLKTDINSFEVESELSENDWRLLRLKFACGNKDEFLQCKALYQAADKAGLLTDGGLSDADAEELSKIASENVSALKTVPGFYNIQITGQRDTKPLYEPKFPAAGDKMSFENFASLCKKISDFSENAVLNLSFAGEPLLHEDFLKIAGEVFKYEGLSLFIETSALSLTDDVIAGLKSLYEKAAESTNGYQKLMFAVSLDAVSAPVYAKMNGGSEADFSKALAAVQKLCGAFPGMVYPQFTRTNHNEEELEAFFRFWNEKTNSSGGNCIIQKYNDFSGLLPACKPADLSPVERNVCWHLRRDMTILADGSVYACPNMAAHGGDNLGNVFELSLEEIWKKSDQMILDHINKKYCEICRACDEYYTFNF
ncbi:spiro-SPASM protein [Treponema sp. C6A8]|uniref:spiro-SPASM protein n=1 Tax=Treponema sp. C6A8 TaxID=1410609 RepID=UPI00048104B5|nr:spiro-SPASM protein [Treponema sp. C6A8]